MINNLIRIKDSLIIFIYKKLKNIKNIRVLKIIANCKKRNKKIILENIFRIFYNTKKKEKKTEKE